jgi:hypothetical protein
LVKQFHQLCKIGQRPGQAIDLVDHNDVHFAGADIGQQTLQSRPVDVAAREAAVVVFGAQQRPAGMGLAFDIGLRSLVLGIQRVEVWRNLVEAAGVPKQ